MTPRNSGEVHFLKEWRLRGGMTQKDFAARCGMSMSSYNYVEAGKSTLTQKAATAIAQYLGIDPGDLLCVDPNETAPYDVGFQTLRYMADHMSPASRAEAGGLLTLVLRLDRGDAPVMSTVAGRPDSGHFLKEWRAHFGLTQKEFAEVVGMSLSNYNYLEYGKTSWSLTTLTAISKAFGVRPADLVSLNPLSGIRNDPAFLHGWDTYRLLSPKGRRLAVQMFERIRDFDSTPELDAEGTPSFSPRM